MGRLEFNFRNATIIVLNANPALILRANTNGELSQAEVYECSLMEM